VPRARQRTLSGLMRGRCRAALARAGRPHGAPGGRSSHFLAPATTAFHAHVAFGSTCQDDPLRCGPSTSQR
jgi:hypothetical protein